MRQHAAFQTKRWTMSEGEPLPFSTVRMDGPCIHERNRNLHRPCHRYHRSEAVLAINRGSPEKVGRIHLIIHSFRCFVPVGKTLAYLETSGASFSQLTMRFHLHTLLRTSALLLSLPLFVCSQQNCYVGIWDHTSILHLPNDCGTTSNEIECYMLTLRAVWEGISISRRC